MKSRILFFVKSARAGGSTFAKNWLATPDEEGYQRVVVNGDNIRLSLYNQRYCSKGEDFVHAIEQVMIRSLLLNDNQKLLLDDTHTTVHSIKKILQLDPDAEAIFIDTSKTVCYDRARQTGQDDLINKGVIDRHFKNLIDLCEYALVNCEKEYYESEFCPIFRRPDKRYILMAVEHIREQIKNAPTNN